MIAGMGGGSRDTPIITPILDPSRTAKRMGKESISGLMGRYMTGNGSAGLNTDMECGQARMDVTLTLVNGNILRLKAMGFISGKTVIDMKESGNSVLNMVTEQTYSGMEIATKENLKKAKRTAKVNTPGQMAQYM